MTVLNTADAVYLGAQAADRVYLGADLVWLPPPTGVSWGPEESLYPEAVAVSNPADPNAFALGSRTTILADGRITGIRFHWLGGGPPSHYVALWSDTGTLLADGTTTGDVPGWNVLPITPVAVTAGQVVRPAWGYTGSAAHGSFSYSNSPPVPSVGPHLRWESGCYVTPAPAGAGGDRAFPANTISPNNYFADVVYQEKLASEPPEGFRPTDLPGLVFWLDAAQITGTADGAPLSAWGDASGNGRNAVAYQGSAVYRSDGINGHPAVAFGEAGITEMRLDPGRAIGERTVFQVVQIGAGPWGPYHTTQFQNTDPYWQTYSSGGVIYTYCSSALSTGATWSGACQFVTFWCDAAGVLGMRVDATEAVGSWTPAAKSAGFHIGANAAGGYGMNGRFGEFLVYDRCLTEPERQAVLDYLGEKWGLG